MPVISPMITKTWYILVHQATSACWLLTHLLVQSQSLVYICNPLHLAHRNLCEHMMVQGVNLTVFCGTILMIMTLSTSFYLHLPASFPLQEHDISYCLFSNAPCVVVSILIDYIISNVLVEAFCR